MVINNKEIYNKSMRILQSLYGQKAEFRPGQYEAIEATMTKHRTLVVQRTGWGKSLVYFICTKLMRERNRNAITVIISPLLVLMENQTESAEKLNLKCCSINSKIKDINLRNNIFNSMIIGDVDLIFITPESLFNEKVQETFTKVSIGLFVVDEAHCISDWGHDFRLEYGRLRKIIQQLPSNVPVLGTTATANDRVVDDLKIQFGEDVYVSRGPLTRESLEIQVLRMRSRIERYAWILQNINSIPGVGIIYCLTQRSCDYLTSFLRKNNVNALAYYSRKADQEYLNEEAENAFKHNKIKVLVATIKLGMGYDKGDISFVIHFQMPRDIVSYYQQIGRAGRDIKSARVFLMCGDDDEDIINYFIDTAFPTEMEVNTIVKLIENNGGMIISEIEANLNIKRSRLEKALSFLQNDGFVFKEGRYYYISPKLFVYNTKHYDEVTNMRRHEYKQMKELLATEECYSKFIVNSLNDYTAEKCGKCSNCLGRELISSSIEMRYLEKAALFLNNLQIKILPRKKWPNNKNIEFVNQSGICLSKYGDPGYGILVKQGKYSKEKKFSDELVAKSAKILEHLIHDEKIKYLTCVPSLRSNLVKDFSGRLAGACGIEFIELLYKTNADQQKTMENSAYQCNNALNSFGFISSKIIPEKIILVDDIVDSKWTLTVCGYILGAKGCQMVFPFALADSSEREA